jgi:hypothetical protein
MVMDIVAPVSRGSEHAMLEAQQRRFLRLDEANLSAPAQLSGSSL